MIYNAKELRDSMEEDLKVRVKLSPTKNPCLAIIQVGHHPQSDKYVGNKLKALERVGMSYRHILLSENITYTEVIDTIQGLNVDKNVHGIMLQLPLPEHLVSASDYIINHIDPLKDVDGLTHKSMGALAMRSRTSVHRPCTALGVVEILKNLGFSSKLTYQLYPELDVRGKNVVVLGKGITSGLPITLMMLESGANVVNLASSCSPEERVHHLERADIVISCTGQPNLISKEDIISPCVLINVGMSVNKEGKLVGDYDPKDFEHEPEIICTSIINSTGIMTVQMLLEKTFNASVWSN